MRRRRGSGRGRRKMRAGTIPRATTTEVPERPPRRRRPRRGGPGGRRTPGAGWNRRGGRAGGRPWRGARRRCRGAAAGGGQDDRARGASLGDGAVVAAAVHDDHLERGRAEGPRARALHRAAHARRLVQRGHDHGEPRRGRTPARHPVPARPRGRATPCGRRGRDGFQHYRRRRVVGAALSARLFLSTVSRVAVDCPAYRTWKKDENARIVRRQSRPAPGTSPRAAPRSSAMAPRRVARTHLRAALAFALALAAAAPAPPPRACDASVAISPDDESIRLP